MSNPSLFRVPAFRDLWLAGAISRFGDALYFIGFPFVVRKITGQDAMVGYVGAMEALPFLLIGPWAGTLADRLDRRRIMAVADVASAAILLLFAGVALFARGHPPAPAFLVGAFALSCARAFFMPAKNAATPNVVGEAGLLRANSFLLGTDQAVWLGSMALSASVLAALWAASPSWFLVSLLAFDAVTFLGSAAFVARLPRLVPERAEVHRVGREIADGLAYVRSRPDLLSHMVSQIGVTLAISPFFTVYMATNERWFGGRPDRLAWVEVTFVAAMLVATVAVGRLRLRRVGFAWSLGIAVCGLSVLAMGMSPVYGIFLAWNVLAGLGIGCLDVPISTWVQATVPDDFRGRVASLRTLGFTAPAPFGMVLVALLLPRIGLAASYALMGAGMVVFGLSPLAVRAFRRAEIPEGAFDAEPPVEPALVHIREPDEAGTLIR